MSRIQKAHNVRVRWTHYRRSAFSRTNNWHSNICCWRSLSRGRCSAIRRCCCNVLVRRRRGLHFWFLLRHRRGWLGRRIRFLFHATLDARPADGIAPLPILQPKRSVVHAEESSGLAKSDSTVTHRFQGPDKVLVTLRIDRAFPLGRRGIRASSCVTCGTARRSRGRRLNRGRSLTVHGLN